MASSKPGTPSYADEPGTPSYADRSFPAYAEKLAWLEAQETELLPDQRNRRRATRTWAAVWPKALAIVIVLAVWELIHVSGWKKEIFPGPAATLANLGDQLRTALLWHAIGTTVERAIIGFGLSVVIGAVIGALVSRIRPLRAAVGSLITGLQTMPSIANGLIAGVDYTPPLLLRAGKMMGLRRFSLYRYLILPASLPAFVAGLKQGWAFAWRSLMAGELLVIIANQPSLGVLLSTYQDQADLESATAIIIVILVIGIVVDSLFGRADGAIRRRWGVTETV